ncbi:phytanoyl-CoA dioxygenase family protein [Paeniroseomonas aquatica]|uniref:Phytanoyl-CoA dioxygenase family protein n=2 Tax=Paeniroseomonas aquatica TaxID=373043 RepID=A0ABT8A8F0_9PROT|nr:phytanoyl-CoA dioxygenase family protein [Paeniroseomonas aquatica]MDN3566094.1 phytanoyl-CoA dioxygenase family protein [Paeniroseomonas aquatica]
MNVLAPAAAGPQPLTRTEHAAGMAAYRAAGEALAAEIGNRGPLRLTPGGDLHPDIQAAYWRHGYYIFEGVIDPAEVAALRADAQVMLDRAPTGPDSRVDSQGRTAHGLDYARLPYRFTRPLADPWGGTQALGGRHPAQMAQPKPDAGAPEYVVFLMYAMCQSMPAGLRLYGHPKLLAAAQAINGADFVPYNDAIFVKQPGLGGSVAWHQDGVTHWDSPNWDEGIHGFNYQVQLYPTTLGNCLWVIPGSHKRGKADIKAMVAANGGSEQLPGAVPLVCAAGDVTMVNRQMVHGSFANTSPDLRISLTFGFHRRSAVLGQKAALAQEGSNAVYDDQRIFDRSAVIQVAIDARHQARPDEPVFRYRPFAGLEDDFRFTPETVERVIRDYNTKDLAI